ncbi:MAG: hypothetical protein AB1749_13095 [Pseudomonadota bacterium]
MSTTFLGHPLAVPAPSVPTETGNFFSRFVATYARHQEAKAARYVRPYLRTMTDADLAALGHSPADIAEIRKAPGETVLLWP